MEKIVQKWMREGVDPKEIERRVHIRFTKRAKKRTEEIGRPLTTQEVKKLFRELGEEIGICAGVKEEVQRE